MSYYACTILTSEDGSRMEFYEAAYLTQMVNNIANSISSRFFCDFDIILCKIAHVILSLQLSNIYYNNYYNEHDTLVNHYSKVSTGQSIQSLNGGYRGINLTM